MSVTKPGSFIAKSSALILLFVACMSVAAFAGRDSYEIYLNNKLVKKQFVGESSSGLLDLKLDQSNINDKLVITYFHCTVKGAGKGRNIQIRNAQNKLVREWKFTDPQGADGSMTIAVKDILELQKQYPATTLNIYYFSSSELPNGLMLAALKPAGKTVSYISAANSIHYARL